MSGDDTLKIHPGKSPLVFGEGVLSKVVRQLASTNAVLDGLRGRGLGRPWDRNVKVEVVTSHVDDGIMVIDDARVVECEAGEGQGIEWSIEEDVEYFRERLVSALGIPAELLEPGRGVPSSGAMLVGVSDKGPLYEPTFDIGDPEKVG